MGKIEHDLLWAYFGEACLVNRIGRRYHDRFRPFGCIRDFGHDQFRNVRKDIHQVILIGANKASELDIRIEDSHLTALAYEALHELHKRAFAHIVCPRLEADPEKSNPFLGLPENPINTALNQHPIAVEYVIENWQSEIEVAAQICEGA